ncbi:MAG TPA: DUF2934 domain-containing protein [Acetobacteraceae bacterium]
MTENPLEPDPAREARIRQRARLLWEEDGSPAGREDDFLDRARFLVGMEEHAGAAQVPLDKSGPVVEEASIQENLGDFPTAYTDFGDRRQTPMTREEERKGEDPKFGNSRDPSR